MNCYNKANICINCKNAVPDNRGHGCEWSRNFDPVPGWTAEPTILRAGGNEIESYRITDCPKFERDDRYKPETAQSRPVRVRCLETGIVYNSMNEAAKSCGKRSGVYIGEQLRQGRSYACGYHWEIVGEDAT